MNSRLTRWCDGFLEAGWLVALLATPLFFNIHSERVFEPDKLSLLRSIAVLMVAVWLVRFIDQQGWRELAKQRFSNPDSFWHKPFVLTVLTLVLVYLLSTLFSVNPRISWAGSYQRLQGTYTTLSYVAIFGIMALTLRTHEQVRRVVSVAIVTSIPVALYGLLQHFGHDPLPWGGDVQTRVAGHMGNAIFIAAYLIMVIPLTLARIVDAFSNILGDERLAAADVVRASVHIFTLAIQLLTLYWSGSRGPLIAMGVGLFSFLLVLLVSLRDVAEDRTAGRLKEVLPAFVFLLPTVVALLISPLVSNAFGPLAAFGFFIGVVLLSVVSIFLLISIRRGWRWLWLGWILLTVLVAGWLLLFNIPAERTTGVSDVPVAGGLFDTLDEWRELPVIGSYGRMLDPTNTTGREKSGRVRVLIWEGVIDLITPHASLEYPDGSSDTFNWLRPVLGYGPESMYTAYNRFYPPELATVEARNASPDRSHNETFDTLVITGIAGFLAWQALYLAVVHFAFRYLGVVRSRRDTWVLIGLWVAGAIIATLATVLIADPVYLGVAVPTGVIVGVVLYLIYYAVFGHHGDRSTATSRPDTSLPFAADRLLMNALVAAVLAHYVEIHFGIAISATRLYFFAYVALMFALGYWLRQAAPAAEEATIPAPVPTKGDKRKRRAAAAPTEPTTRAGWQRLVVPALLLVLMLGVLGYGYITYALPPDKVITGPADLSAGEIFRQSVLQNSRKDFADWPFVMSMIILSWSLGWLVFLSEMVKHGEIKLDTRGGPTSRGRAAAVVLLVLAVVGIGARFIVSAETTTATVGLSLGLIAAVVCALVAGLLLAARPSGQLSGGIVAASLVIFAFPILLSGAALPAAIMILGGGVVFWLLWDGEWRQSLLPMSAVILASLLGGFAYIFAHATNYRSILFYRGSEPPISTTMLRALEASQASGLITFFFAFIFVMLLLLAFALSWPGLTKERSPRTNARPAVVYSALILAFIAAFFIIAQSNVRPVQADMIFKRARPYDDQATRATQIPAETRRELWDTAIDIYTTAIDRMPAEDFYYLFLGRASLERAAITENPAEQADLLSSAETLLLQAQDLNPLNTDHTANLARLNTRWYAAVDDESEKAERLDLAERYYEDALRLSPQNSIIRNELARLVLELRGDCDRALALYDEGAAIDPFYTQTQLARADAYILCSSGRSDEERDELYRAAAGALEQGLERAPNNIRAWIQLAEIYRQLGEFDQAAAAVENARARNNPVTFPMAEIDFIDAQIAAGLGDLDEARILANRALETAGADTAAQIEAFLEGLGNE